MLSFLKPKNVSKPEPAEPQPAEPEPAEPEPAEPEPVELEPVELEPAEEPPAEEQPAPELLLLREAVRRSRMFSPQHYALESGASGDYDALLDHYLEHGAAEGLSPSPDFDRDFYLATYKDVADAGVDPFKHYVLYGQREFRCPSLKRALADADIIRASDCFSSKHYRRQRGDIPGKDGVLDYMIHGALNGLKPHPEFEQHFVFTYYGDLLRGFTNPFVFYCKHADRPWCVPNQAKLNAVLDAVGRSGQFDGAFYRERYLDDRPDIDPLLHYCTSGYLMGNRPSAGFDGNLYLRRYRDVLKAELNPAYHFETHGRKEGRTAGSAAASAVRTGERTAEAGRPTILVVCHEASVTGAPIVGLSLVRALSGQANVITWIGKDGPLTKDFVKASTTIVIGFHDEADRYAIAAELARSYDVAFAVLNSVVSSPALGPLRAAGVPVVSLVHEFGEYVRPRGWLSSVVAHSAKTVFPAEIVKESALAEFDELRLAAEPTNIVIRHQGRCKVQSQDEEAVTMTAGEILARIGVAPGAERPTIVFGCGWAQPRKGLDLFVEAARIVKSRTDRPFRFVWVGGNYKPDTDMAYSVYIADQVKRSRLSDTVVFFDEQGDLDAFWSLADIFFLSSRLDPFPNVALDAIEEGVPVVCFEQATGIGELAEEGSPAVRAVPYNDSEAAAAAILDLAERRSEVEAQLKREAAAWKGRLDFATYAQDVFDLGMEAAREDAQRRETAERIARDGLFDAPFFAAGYPKWADINELLPVRRISEVIAACVDTERNGFPLARPAIGARSAGSGRALGAEAFLPDGRIRMSHAAPRATDVRAPWSRAENAVVLIHAAQALPETLIEAVKQGEPPFRTIITTGDPDFAGEMEHVFAAAPGVEVHGDVGFFDPVIAFLKLLETLGPEIALIGHLFAAAPTEAEKAFGRPLDSYLHDFVLRKSLLNEVFDFFEREPALGLLFPEQPRIVGSRTSREAARGLLKAIDRDREELPERFPVDMTFWLRPDRMPALRDPRLLRAAQAFVSGVTPQSRIDGFSRLLPVLAEDAGAGWTGLCAPDALKRGDGRIYMDAPADPA